MWRNYLIVGVRTLARDKTSAAINILGLAIGMAACILILVYVRYEHRYDRALPGSERLYQVQTALAAPGRPVVRAQTSPTPLRDALVARFPEIEAATQIGFGPTVTVRKGEATFIDAGIVDPGFFRVFPLPFAHGTAATALPDANGIVLTETEAIRQFGTADVLGRTIPLGAGEGRHDARVTGVLRDPGRDTNLRFGILVLRRPSEETGGWSESDRQLYVRLRPGADAAAIEAALPAWERRVIPPDLREGRPDRLADALTLKLVPIGDVHLGPAQAGAVVPGGDPVALAAFSVTAVLTLGMAILNFVNLATARAMRRAREVALRKALGATGRQLVVQFLAEALVTAAVAMLLGLSLAELLAPRVGTWLGVELRIDHLGRGGLLLPEVALLVATGLAAGVYPAFHLSRFRPTRLLRDDGAVPDLPAGLPLRTILVALQFAAAIGLVACTWIIAAQTRHVETVDPGYRRDGLIQLEAAWRFAGDAAEYAAAERALRAVPGVVGVGRTGLGLSARDRTNVPVRLPGAGGDVTVGLYPVDAAFLPVIGAPLLAGRHLDERYGRDRMLHPAYDADPAAQAAVAHRLTSRGLNVVINRTAAALFGFDTPAAAVGGTIVMATGEAGAVPSTIVGVVGDTRVRTARDAAEPIVYAFDPDRTSQVLVRYAGVRPGAVMAGINRVWRRFEPEIPFQGRFAEDIAAEVYAADRARGALFAGFTGLAVAIACLGLYGLAAFAADRRRKEIGIRKVLGARTRDIVRLLVWQFSRPVLVANLIAWPVAWWAMRRWLDGFDTRIALTPTPFLAAGLLALVVAIGAVAGHAVRAARASPIHALRRE